MKITAITVPSADPARLARFYADFGFRVDTPDQTSRVIDMGHTRVTIVPGPQPTGAHHLALAIPTALLAGARARLAAQVPLRTRDGTDQFHFDPPFGPADSIYADDPDGTLLELIARDRPSMGDAFDPRRDVAGVGEIAVPVASVPEAVDQLRRTRHLSAVIQGPEFAAVGDHEGMIILADRERTWFPTEDREPELTPLHITIETAGPTVIFSFGTELN